jgi:hypothetical protein
MTIDAYESEELKSFYRVLEAAIAEAKARSLNLPIYEMTNRLFAAAAHGERDPARLKSAVLDGLNESPLVGFRSPRPAPAMPPSPIARTRRKSGGRRPTLTLFPKA